MSTPFNPELPSFGSTCLHDAEVATLTVGGDGTWADIELSFLDLPLHDTVDDWGPHWHCEAVLELRQVRGFRSAFGGEKGNALEPWISLFLSEQDGGAPAIIFLTPSVPLRVRAGRLALLSPGEIGWDDAVVTLVVRAGEPASARGPEARTPTEGAASRR